MQDRRITTRLVGYWERLKKDRAMPSYTIFTSGPVEDIWEQCFTVRVSSASRNTKTYVFEHFGDKLKEVYGRDMQGEMATSALRHLPGAAILRQIDQIQNNPPSAITEQGQFINERDKIIRYRACLLPFGDEKKGITHIICGLSWRMF